MTTGTRRWLLIGGSALAVLLAAALAVPFLVDINRYHDLIVSQAEKMLGRDVSLGRMSLRLLPLPGVSVSAVSVASDRRGESPLLKTESLSARARLLPLLRGRIAVASLVIRRPELVLHRRADGQFNLPAFAAPAPAGAAAAPAPASPGASPAFSLSHLRIVGARLRLVDDAALPGSTVTTTLDRVDLSLDGFAPGRPFSLDLAASLPPRDSASLSLKGTVALPPEEPGSAPGATQVSLRLRKFQPSAFAPYFRAFAGIDPPAGSVSADLDARARLRTNAQRKWELDGEGSLKGALQLRDVALKGAAGAAVRRKGDLDLALDLALSDGGRRMTFNKLEASTGKTRLVAGGRLELGERSSRIDVSVRPSQVMAEDLATVAAVLGAKFPAGLTSAAPITFSGSAAGPLDQPTKMKFRGEIALSGVRYADPALGRPVEDVGGKLNFDNGSLKVTGFTARVGDTKVAGSLALTDFQSPRLTLSLTSPRANLDDLLSLLTPTAPARPAAAPAAPAGDILARTRGTGTIRIDEGSFGTFRFSRFDGKLRLEGKVVTFDPVSFQLYGGTYRGSLSADLRGAVPRYAYRSTLAGVDGQKFLAENLGIKDLLAGTVSADVTMEGGGSDLDHLLDSLKGQGSVKVEKGWIGQLNVLGGISKVSDLLGEKTLSKLSGEIAKNRTDFSSLTGDIHLSGGRATTDNLKVVSTDLDLSGKGSFTLAGMLDLDLKVLFSPELTTALIQEGSRARYLDREGNRLVLPLTIKGPLEGPTYGVDLNTIARAAAKSQALEKLSKSGSPLGQLAAGLLGKKEGGAQPPPAAGGAPGSAAPAAGETASGDQAIRITSGKYGGNFLIPDLTIRGEFTGTGLSRADLKVEDKGGRVLIERSDAFKQIAAYYATHDRAAPARIPFKVKIDGKVIAGAGDLRITITLHRSDGTRSVQTFTQAKRGL